MNPIRKKRHHPCTLSRKRTLGRSNTRAGEVGWAGLAGTYYFINPRHNLAAVAMSQYQGPDGAVLMETLRRGVYGALKE